MDGNLSSAEATLGPSPAENMLERHVFLSRNASGACTTLYDEVAQSTTVESSPFTPRLHTNYVPSDEDIVGIRRAMDGYEEKARNIDKEIAEVLTALSMKIAQRNAYLKAREDHRVLLTPIRRIPFDLIQEIFYASTCEAIFGPSLSPTELNKHPSIVISQVCREWRQISLRSPKLWAAMTVTCPRRIDEPEGSLQGWIRKMAFLTEAIKFWTTRSGVAPFTLGVNAQDTISPDPDDSTAESMMPSFREFTAAVQQSSTRWKHFSLRLDVNYATWSLLDIFRLTPAQLGSLESLEVHLCIASRIMDSPEVIELFQLQRDTALLSVPSLRRLSLSGAWRDVASPETINGLPALECLELCVYNPITEFCLDGHQLLQIIRGVPTLTQLSFGQDVEETIPVLRLPSPVVMPALTSITLDWHSIPINWAPSVDAPFLRNLDVGYYDGEPIQDIDSGIVEMYRQFGRTLTTTSFAHTSVTPSALVIILRNLPNLEQLDLTPAGARGLCNVVEPAEGSDRLVLAKINGREGDGIRCPKLQVLKMEVQDIHTRDNVMEEAIMEFLKTRLEASMRRGLREVDVLLWPPLQDSALDVEGELMSQGFALGDLVLNVRYKSGLAPLALLG